VAAKEATLEALVNPKGEATSYRFEYGISTEYGSSVPAEAEQIGSGTYRVEVSQELTGLEPSTTYHYRVVAENAKGEGDGGDRVFTTRAEGAPWLVATEYPVTIEGEQGSGAGAHALGVEIGDVVCQVASVSGDIEQGPASSLSLVPSFEECEFDGVFGVGISTNGCTYTATLTDEPTSEPFEASVALECPEGAYVQIGTTNTCRLRLFSQDDLGKVGIENNSGTLDLTLELSEIAYEEVGKYCANVSTVQTDGTYTGTTVLHGSSEEEVDLEMTTEP